MHSLAVRRAALVATRAASSSSSSSSRSRSSSSRRGLSRSAALSSSSTTKSPLALLRQRPFPPSPLAPPIYSPRHRQQHVRCYASRKEEDKSWGEIAEDAAKVAKGALKKLGVGALTVVEKVLGGGGGGDKSSPSSSTSTRQRPRPGDEGDGDSFWGPMSGPSSSSSPQRRRRGGGEDGGPLAGFPSGGGGLLGGLVGSVLGKAVQGAFSAIAEQSREAGALADAALAAASADPAVRDEFGGALSRPAGSGGFGSVAQSSSTVVVNGRAQKSTSVSFPILGPRGVGGFLEATSVSGGGGDGRGGGSGGEEVVVRVKSQRGKVIVVGGSGGGTRGSGGGGGGGQVIDVDFKEV